MSDTVTISREQYGALLGLMRDVAQVPNALGTGHVSEAITSAIGQLAICVMAGPYPDPDDIPSAAAAPGEQWAEFAPDPELEQESPSVEQMIDELVAAGTFFALSRGNGVISVIVDDDSSDDLLADEQSVDPNWRDALRAAWERVKQDMPSDAL